MRIVAEGLDEDGAAVGDAAEEVERRRRYPTRRHLPPMPRGADQAGVRHAADEGVNERRVDAAGLSRDLRDDMNGSGVEDVAEERPDILEVDAVRGVWREVTSINPLLVMPPEKVEKSSA